MKKDQSLFLTLVLAVLTGVVGVFSATASPRASGQTRRPNRSVARRTRRITPVLRAGSGSRLESRSQKRDGAVRSPGKEAPQGPALARPDATAPRPGPDLRVWLKGQIAQQFVSPARYLLFCSFLI